MVLIGRFLEIPIQLFYYFYLWEYCSTYSYEESFGHSNPLLADQSLGCYSALETPDSEMDDSNFNSSKSPSTSTENQEPLFRESRSGGMKKPLQFYNVPLGVMVQIFLFIRLMVSCFVGHWEMGTEIRSQKEVVRHVCKNMWKTLILAFPYQIIEPLSECKLPFITILFMFNYIFAFRWHKIVADFMFVERYLGPLYKLFCFFLYAYCLDSFFAFFWMVIPFWNCYEDGTLQKNHLEFSACANKDCTLQTFHFPNCTKKTWLASAPYSLPPVPIIDNDTIAISYYSPARLNVPLLLADLHVFTSLRTVGIGVTTAVNSVEFGLSVVMIFVGYYLFTWKLSGLMQMFYLEKELKKSDYRNQLSIIQTYCEFHGVCARSQLRMRNFLALKAVWDRDLFNDVAFNSVTDEYRTRIIAATVLTALEKVRLFRGIPIQNLIALCDQFQTMLFIRGQTIKRPGEAASGLMLLRRGVVVVVSLEDDGPGSGSIVKLESGDYFGEVNLLLPTGTPLLILAATDCEVWMLHSKTYANLARFFTGAVKSRLLFNLKSIMDATVCVFHEEYDIFSPRHLKKYVQQFAKGDIDDFPLHLCENENRLRRQGLKAKLHDKSRKYLIWSYIAAILGLLAMPLSVFYTFPADVLDVIWPANPYSIYVHCKNIGDLTEGVTCTNWEWTYSLFIWAISFFCIADCIIWFYIGIVSPYGIISGREATRRKFMFSELGAATLAKIVSTFYIAFKVLRFRDVVKSFVPASLNSFIFTLSMSLVVFVLCYYASRIFLVFRINDWEHHNFCDPFQNQWGKTRDEVIEKINDWCWKTLGIRTCHNLSLFEDERFRDKEFFEKNYAIFNDGVWTQSLSVLCEQNKTITPSLHRFYTSLYIFYDFATTQGSGNVVNFWGIDRSLPEILKIVTDVALLITAAMTAKITARNLGAQIDYITYRTGQKSLKQAMRMRNVPPFVQSHMLHYLDNAYVTYNRIAMSSAASAFQGIPNPFKSTRKQHESFLNIMEFLRRDHEFVSALFNRCKHFIYPPGCILTAAGSGDVFVFIITSGLVCAVDCLGVKTIRGPGTILSIKSLWVREHFFTAISMTHVKAIILDESSIMECLFLYPRIARIWTEGFKQLAPIFVVIIAEIKEKKLKPEDHDKIVEAVVYKARREDFHKTYKMRKHPRWYRIFLHRTFFLSPSQASIGIFLIGGIIHSMSAFVATLQCAFVKSTPSLNYLSAVLDALVLLELYFRIHLVEIEGDRFITCPAEIAKRVMRRDWSHIPFMLPLELLIVPFKSTFGVKEFHHYYLILRGLRSLRFLETIRRTSAVRQQINVSLQFSTWISCIFHIFIHIHVMGIIWFYMNCQPTYIVEGDHRYTYCKKGSWQVRMFDKRKNFYNASGKGVFASELLNINNLGLLFTRQSIACVLGECPEPINSKYDVYMVSGNPARLLGERIDEFSINMAYIELSQCYSLCIYWAAQTLTLTGFGDISIASYEEMYLFYLFFLTSLIHAAYITSKIVSVHISYDPDENEAFAEKAETHSYLTSKQVPQLLIKLVKRSKEMHQAFHIGIIPRVKRDLPKIIFNQVRYHSCLPVFRKMLLHDSCTHGQLSLLSSLLVETIVPQGDYIVRRGEVVDGIFIIADGTARYVQGQEVLDTTVNLEDQDNTVQYIKTQTHSWSMSHHRSTRSSRFGDGIFGVGTCFGIEGSEGGDFPLAFWHYDIIARHNCRLFYLSGRNLAKYQDHLEPARIILKQQVINTKDEIKMFRRVESTSLSSNWNEKSAKRGCVFHPTDSLLNVILIFSHSLKLNLILMSLAFALYVGKRGDYPDEKFFTYKFKRPAHFEVIYVLMLTLAYLCVVLEIAMANFTGFIHEGRTIMDEKLIRENYRKKKSMMLIDVLSMIPSPYFYLITTEKFHTGLALFLFVPQMLQIFRTIQYFSLPRQAEPFSAVILTTKTVVRIILLVTAFVIVVSLVLIYTSCSELQPECRYTWIEFALKKYEIETNVDIFLLSVYFTITILVTTGYGDLTGHVVFERIALTIIMCVCMIVVAVCQAKITTSIFKIAARAKMYSERIEKLRMALEANEVKPEVISHVTGYLKVAYGHHGGKQLQTLLKDLHPSLRKQVHYVICQDFIRQLPHFSTLPMGVLQYMALFVDAACYLPGDVIVGYGDVVSAAYYISEGQAIKKGSCSAERFGVKLQRGQVCFRKCLVRPHKTNYCLVAEKLTIVYFLEYVDFSRIIYSLSHIAEEECMAKTWCDYHTAMQRQYGNHKVYKNLAMDQAQFRLSDTFSLLQKDLKCREKLKVDLTNSEHAGYQLNFVPNEDLADVHDG